MSAGRRASRGLLNWARSNPAQSVGYAFLSVIALVMAVMAVMLALHSGLLGFTVGSPPGDRELAVFATFIGGGLATAVTLFGALLTTEHNARERRRLDFETIVKGLEALPAGKPERVAGILSTTVLIGQPRVAIRILEPAWEAGEVDDGTATWIIDEILADGALQHPYHLDGEFADETTMVEATSLLLEHAASRGLTNPRVEGEYAFPGRLMDKWNVGGDVPVAAKEYVLQAMGEVLLSQDKAWWCGDAEEMQQFPIEPWLDCALATDEDESVRESAAVLFSALHSCFPEEEQRRFDGRHAGAEAVLRRVPAENGVKANGECLELAGRIATDWGGAP
ncbi:hypothetical protein [Streptomyces sp. MAI_2237]